MNFASSPMLPLQQHHNFGAALKLMGRDVCMIETPDTAPVQMIKRFRIGFVPRGPIWKLDRGQSRSLKQLRTNRLTILNSDAPNDSALKAAGYRQLMTAASVAELCIDGSETERLKRARSNWRNSLRRAERDELSVTFDRFDAFRHQWLLMADLEQQRAKRFRALPHSLIHAFASIMPSDVIVCAVRLGQIPIAAMLFLVHDKVATYHIGWANAQGRAVCAHHLMLMRTANLLAKRGVKRIDLGTVDTENNPGLARFKIGSGAHIRPLGGTWIGLPNF